MLGARVECDVVMEMLNNKSKSQYILFFFFFFFVAAAKCLFPVPTDLEFNCRMCAGKNEQITRDMEQRREQQKVADHHEKWQREQYYVSVIEHGL